MQTLSVSEYGIHYMQLCFQYYKENCAYFLFYAAALLFIIFKGNKQERAIFLPGALLMLLTIFNPVFPVIINHVFDINKEYYRFFWIPPVVILTAYFGAKVITSQKGIKKYIVLAAIVLILVSTGQFVYADGYIKAPNIYKMPTELPRVAELIHEDSDLTYPKAIFEFDYNMLIRQYDATILLSADREAYLNAVSGTLDMDTILLDENYYNRLLAVVALNIEIPREKFIEGLENTGTEYVVVSTISPVCEYLENAGLELTGMTENHSVYRYHARNRQIFELPDYSEVWENY